MSDNQVIPEAAVQVLRGGLWSPSKPIRDTSMWHQWKRERACAEHEWHPEPDSMGLEWFCGKCSKETEGATKVIPEAAVEHTEAQIRRWLASAISRSPMSDRYRQHHGPTARDYEIADDILSEFAVSLRDRHTL